MGGSVHVVHVGADHPSHLPDGWGGGSNKPSEPALPTIRRMVGVVGSDEPSEPTTPTIRRMVGPMVGSDEP